MLLGARAPQTSPASGLDLEARAALTSLQRKRRDALRPLFFVRDSSSSKHASLTTSRTRVTSAGVRGHGRRRRRRAAGSAADGRRRGRRLPGRERGRGAGEFEGGEGGRVRRAPQGGRRTGEHAPRHRGRQDARGGAWRRTQAVPAEGHGPCSPWLVALAAARWRRQVVRPARQVVQDQNEQEGEAARHLHRCVGAPRRTAQALMVYCPFFSYFFPCGSLADACSLPRSPLSQR